jgi:hypothetical protein
VPLRQRGDRAGNQTGADADSPIQIDQRQLDVTQVRYAQSIGGREEL